MYNNNRLGSTLLAFLIGGLVGATVALFMAPQSGEEMRSLLRDKSNEIKDKALESAEDTRSRAEKTLNDTKDKVSHLANRTRKEIERNMP